MNIKSERGSVIILVLFISVGLGLVLTSISRLSIQEMRLNQEFRIRLEAKNAAEAAVENGFSQLVKRFDKETSFPVKALSPASGDPLVLTESFYDLFETDGGVSGSNIDLPKQPYDPLTEWNTQTCEVIGGVVPPGVWKFIHSYVPGNEFDPLRDKRVLVREVVLIGKATAIVPGSNKKIQAYVGQSLQVRDAPLFAYAIFYNMDMEIAPGPRMDIRGAVHANGNMYIQANSSLNFYNDVSATGDIFHGPYPDIPKGTSYGAVTFPDSLGNQLSMKTGSGWLDSSNPDFRSLASNRWNGNVQSAAHGIRPHNPVSIDSYQRDNPDTLTKDDPLNYAYQLIQPPLNKNDDGYSPDIEGQKFSLKAGMVIEVDTDAEAYDVYIYDRDEDGNVVYDEDGNFVRKPLDLADTSTIEVDFYKDDGADEVEKGLYDWRMGEGISLVTIDMKKMKDSVEVDNGDNEDWGEESYQKPSEWWNGIVYVEFPTQNATGRTSDNVNPAIGGWAVKLKNGGGGSGGIPNLEEEGTTISTNAPLYVQGHYNADGNSSTGSANDSDNGDEPPAAIIADAITILSKDWEDKDSLKSLSTRRSNGFTEVSAAILTGLVVSDKSGANNYSGGVENFPRFLEDWGHLRYRGSMVSLFESEVATERWGKGGVYRPPVRDWGFHSLFKSGTYPPGTPNTRTYRRVNYENLTGEEYQEAIELIQSQF